MATIAQTSVTGVNGPVTLTRTTMTASDTLAYVQGSGQILTLANNTGSTVTPVFTGSVQPNINVPGYGGTVSTAAGKSVAVAANSTVAFELDDISQFLQGTVTITAGTALIATLTV
jgi:hypothetical protein